MTADGRGWDDEALHLNLIDMDARAVQQIALGRARDDFLGLVCGEEWDVLGPIGLQTVI